MRLLTTTLLSTALTAGLWAETMATVNGKAITEEDMFAIAKTMPGMKLRNLDEKQKRQIVDQAIERSLLLDQAKKEKIENTKEFKEALLRVKDDLALETWMKQQFDKISVSNAEIKAFYDENKQRYNSPERVKARHILVKEKSEAESVIKELQKSDNIESKFIELAKSKSTGPSGPKGGDLGWFGKGQMVPAFSDAAFALEKGAFTKSPVKTRFGHHVIYLEDKKEGGVLPLAQVQRVIEQELKMKKFKENVSEVAKKLKSKAKITYN